VGGGGQRKNKQLICPQKLEKKSLQNIWGAFEHRKYSTFSFFFFFFLYMIGSDEGNERDTIDYCRSLIKD
jgi:hypothetical protein